MRKIKALALYSMVSASQLQPKRYDYIDIARGLAILCVIQWHVCNRHVAWIDTWAMPVFFVIMGIFFRPALTWRDMIVKKARTILLPFVILSIPSYIQNAIQLPLSEFIQRVIDPFNCVHGVGWFLICMFWCYMIYYGIHRVANGKMYLKVLISLAVSFTFFYLSTLRPPILGGHRMVFPFFLSTSFTCMALVSAGELLKTVLLKDRCESRKLLVMSILSGGAILYFFGCKGGAMIVNDYYGQPYILWLANSIIGSISIIEISKYLPSFMAFFGKHSLLMLMVHPYVKRIVMLFTEPSVLRLLIVVAITTILVYLFARYVPITEGKLKEKH